MLNNSRACGRVLVHLLHQRVEVRELLLVADLRDELHFQLARRRATPAKSNTCTSSSGSVPSTVGRNPRLATPARGVCGCKASTPRTRTA